MKTMNLKVMRSFIRKEVGVAILSIILVGFLFPSKIQAKEFFNSVAIKNIDNSNSVNSTTYFINDTRFSFTGSNVGSIFWVPKRCEARLMTAIVANDKVAENITIEVWNTSGYRETTLSIPTNKALVTTFNIGGGDHYLKYHGRAGVTYNVRLQLYTWDY